MALRTLNITIKGTSALMTHNGNMADPLNPIVQSLKKISSKRTKVERDHLLMSQLELLGGVYPEHDLTNEEDPGFIVSDDKVELTGNWGNCMVPEHVIEATIINGAKKRRKGTAFKAGMRVTSPSFIMVNEQPITVEEVFKNRKYKLTSRVNVNNSAIMRTRPLFPNWHINFDCLLDDEVVNMNDLQEALEDAGRLVGLGDWRPRFVSLL